MEHAHSVKFKRIGLFRHIEKIKHFSVLIQAFLIKVLGMYVHKHEALIVTRGSVQHCSQIVSDMAYKKQKIQNSPRNLSPYYSKAV